MTPRVTQTCSAFRLIHSLQANSDNPARRELPSQAPRSLSLRQLRQLLRQMPPDDGKAGEM